MKFKIPTFKSSIISDLVKTPNKILAEEEDSGIVWDSEKVREAEEAISKGRKYAINGRIVSPYFEKIKDVKAPDLVFKYSKEELDEVKKCRNDIEYFAEKYCKIKTEDGKWKSFKLRGYQKKYLKNTTDNRYMVLLSSRQVGKTVISGIILLHYALFNVEKNVLIVANKGKTVTEILGKIKMVYMKLPFFLKAGVKEWSKSQVVFDNESKFITETTTENSGVGLTIDFLYADEFARIDDSISREFWRAVWPTIVEINNSRCIITSTANGYNLFHEIYDKAMKGLNEFKHQVVYWYDVPGRDEKWKEMQIATVGIDKFNQDFGCQFQSGNSLLLDPATIDRIEEGKVKYTHNIFDELEDLKIDYSNLLWNPKYYDSLWEEIEKKRFILSIDLAHGIGQDYSVINIFEICLMTKKEIEKVRKPIDEKDFLKLKQIGLFRSNSQPVSEIALITMELVRLLGVESVMINVEVNQGGDYFIKCLSEDDDYYDDLILHTIHNQNSSIERPGVKINKSNKIDFCKDTKELLRQNKIEIDEEETINEFSYFALNSKGSYSSQTGHDDIAMTIVNMVPAIKSFYFSELSTDVFDLYEKELLDLCYDKISLNPDSEYVDYDKVYNDMDTIRQNQMQISRDRTIKDMHFKS